MGRPREPVKLIQVKGKAHMTKRQILDREASEIEVPPARICPPKSLDAQQRRMFRHYAKLLTEIGIFTVLDVDCLARYVRAQSQYDKLCAYGGFLPFICRLDADGEVHDEANWGKAIPSLPYMPDLLDELRSCWRGNWPRSVPTRRRTSSWCGPPI